MKPKPNQLFFLFAIVSLLEIVFVITNNQNLRYFSKPLIIPLLAAIYLSYQYPRKAILKDHILLGLLFSWIGDVLLQMPDLFIPGLLSFLTAHIFYIIYFTKTKSDQNSFFKLRPIMLIAVMAYLVEFMYILWPTLGPMRIPVLVYGITISTMLSAALWQYQKLENKTALYFIIGATLFVTSDSLLALNMFKENFSMAGILIMSTYILAQLFIVLGAIRQQVHSQTPSTTT
ncbi:MAG: hypothetical protein RL000_1078 [Bacteroidota bacterium]|jgi:uncharacterized membrane protein YhhN